MAENTSVVKVYTRAGVHSRTLDWATQGLSRLTFTLTAQRGCSNATLEINRDSDSGYLLDRDEFVVVFLDDESTTPVYCGFVSSKKRDRRGFSQTYELRGFADYLAGISISEEEPDKKVWFGSEDPDSPDDYIVARVPDDSHNVQTISEAVQWIYDNLIGLYYADILWDEDEISFTDRDIESLEFDSSVDVFRVLEELSTLASVEGAPVYFGVNALKTLYFRQLTADNNQELDVNELNIEFSREDFGEVYNVLLLTTGMRGADGKKLRYRYRSETSLLHYRPRRKSLEKAWLLSKADADAYAAGFFSKYSTPFESFEISQFTEEDPYDSYFRPWQSWIKVTDGFSGEQRFTPFLEINYDLTNVMKFTLSVARLEDDLVIGSDGSPNINVPDDDFGGDQEEEPADENDGSKRIVVDPVRGLLTSEDGMVDSFAVKLSQPPVGSVTFRLSGAVSVGESRSVEFTTSDETDTKTVSMTDVNLDGDADLGVRLSSRPSQTITVTVTTEAAGVTPTEEELEFTTENWDTIQVISFTGIDSPDNPQFDVSFTLETDLSDDVQITVRTDDISEGLIREGSSGAYTEEVILNFDPSNYDEEVTIEVEGQDDDGTLEIGIRLNTEPSDDVTLSFDPEYGTAPDPIVFTPENWNVEQIVRFGGVPPDVELPLFNTYDIDMEMTDGTAPVTALLSLNSGVPDDVEIEPTLSSEFITFTDVDDPVTVQVSHTQYSRKEEDVLYTVSLTPVSDDQDYNNASAGPVEVTNIDNDLHGLRVSPLDNLHTAERGASKDQTFTVVLASKPTHTVVVTLHSNDTSSGQWKDPSSGVVSSSDKTLTFETTDWNISRTITLVGIDDGIPTGEGDPDTREYSVTLTGSSTDPDYDQEIELPVTHDLTTGGGISVIVANDEDPENDTRVRVEDEEATFRDMFQVTEEGTLELSNGTVANVLQRGLGLGVIIGASFERIIPADGTELRLVVLVTNNGRALTDISGFKVKVPFSFYPSDGSAPDTGTMTLEADDAVVYSGGLSSFTFVGAGFPKPGYLLFKVQTVSGDPETQINVYPPDPDVCSLLVVDVAFTGDVTGLINPAVLGRSSLITGYLPIISP